MERVAGEDRDSDWQDWEGREEREREVGEWSPAADVDWRNM